MNASAFSLFQNIPEPFRRRLTTLRTRLSILPEPMGRPCAFAAVTAAADRPSRTPPTSRSSSSSMSCSAMPPGLATSPAQTPATRSAIPATPSMNFVLNVSTTSAMSRVTMSALLSWFSECRPAAVAAPSAAKRTGAGWTTFASHATT